MTYLLDDNGDLDLSFTRVEGLQQRAGKILLTSKGEIRSYPTLGVDIVRYQRSKINAEALKKVIELNLRMDNISPRKVVHQLNVQ